MSENEHLTLDEIYALAFEKLINAGADEHNASILSKTIQHAERDGSISHGLFRLPAYINSLKSGKINPTARPELSHITPSLIRVDAQSGLAPTAHALVIPELAKAAQTNGVAVAAINRCVHMAALWPEVEAIADHNLAGLACTNYMPMVAPVGANKAFFGTNPIAFAWPRPGKNHVVYDMATAAMAMGEVQVAAREGHEVPEGTGLDATGQLTKDPSKILDGGVLLPFGGHKGYGLSLMVELLTAGLIGETFSDETKDKDIGDGGPPIGGQFLLALSPEVIAIDNWQEHCDEFFNRLSGLPGKDLRLPGERRYKNRLSNEPREINSDLLKTIKDL